MDEWYSRDKTVGGVLVSRKSLDPVYLGSFSEFGFTKGVTKEGSTISDWLPRIGKVVVMAAGFDAVLIG